MTSVSLDYFNYYKHGMYCHVQLHGNDGSKQAFQFIDGDAVKGDPDVVLTIPSEWVINQEGMMTPPCVYVRDISDQKEQVFSCNRSHPKLNDFITEMFEINQDKRGLRGFQSTQLQALSFALKRIPPKKISVAE